MPKSEVKGTSCDPWGGPVVRGGQETNVRRCDDADQLHALHFITVLAQWLERLLVGRQIRVNPLLSEVVFCPLYPLLSVNPQSPNTQLLTDARSIYARLNFLAWHSSLGASATTIFDSARDEGGTPNVSQ